MDEYRSTHYGRQLDALMRKLGELAKEGFKQGDPEFDEVWNAIDAANAKSMGKSKSSTTRYMDLMKRDPKKARHVHRKYVDPDLPSEDWFASHGESQSTEAGIIEALMNGDCTVAEAIESLEEVAVGNAYGATYNKRDQGILGRQVNALTNVKTPQIDWGQQQQQKAPQLPPEIQPLYDQYMQAVQSGDQMTANKLKQNLVWELQIQGIDPATVGIR